MEGYGLKESQLYLLSNSVQTLRVYGKVWVAFSNTTGPRIRMLLWLDWEAFVAIVAVDYANI
jgi:hypothetical protein